MVTGILHYWLKTYVVYVFAKMAVLFKFEIQKSLSLAPSQPKTRSTISVLKLSVAARSSIRFNTPTANPSAKAISMGFRLLRKQSPSTAQLLYVSPRRLLSSRRVSSPLPPPTDLPSVFRRQVASALPDSSISENPYDLRRVCIGESHVPSPHLPAAILRPRNTDDVVAIVKLCQEHNVAVVPFGGGTSLEGHVAAADGRRPTVCLDTALMGSIDFTGSGDGGRSNHFYADRMAASGDGCHVLSAPSVGGTRSAPSATTLPDMDATIGPAVTRPGLNTSLRHAGLAFMVDPGSPDATIAGMVNENYANKCLLLSGLGN